MKKICILGAGTYGSYLANGLTKKYPDVEVMLLEIGNNLIKSEEEIGFCSFNMNEEYMGAKKGRFFGYGGTSAKWGGQLLFYSNLDCLDDVRMDYIKETNIQYKTKVLARFFKKNPNITDELVQDGIYTKTGIWLKFNQRNLFKYFQIERNKRIKIKSNSRVIRLIKTEESISSVIIIRNGIEEELKADIFYLTCGALESVRLLSYSNLFNNVKSSGGLSDHISYRCLTVKSSKPFFCKKDFSYYFQNNSLITKRLVGEVDGHAFYIQPVFNENFTFFQFLKNLIFQQKFSIKKLIISCKQFIHLFPFVYYYFLK